MSSKTCGSREKWWYTMQYILVCLKKNSWYKVSEKPLMRNKAAELYDEGLRCGEEANLAKLLASQAAWEAANVAMNTYGGYGFCSEFDIERKFRETRLYITAPVSNNMVLSYIAEHVLKLPRSY